MQLLSSERCFFMGRVHFFYYFWSRFDLQNSKKSVPSRGKCNFWLMKSAFSWEGYTFFTIFDPGLTSKIVKKVYPLEKMQLLSSERCFFMGRVHFFYYFWSRFDLQNSKKSVPSRGKCNFWVMKGVVPWKMATSVPLCVPVFIRFDLQNSKKSVPSRGKCNFWLMKSAFSWEGYTFFTIFDPGLTSKIVKKNSKPQVLEKKK